ncbi:MAG: hypothetical protein ACRYGR_09465 [Janthinobacterium lividum]
MFSNNLIMKASQKNFTLPITGVDVLLSDSQKIAALKGKRVGLISSQSFLTADFKPSAYGL